MTSKSKSETTKYVKHKIHDISLDQLTRDANQPRKHFDESELDTLKQSIEEKGLIYPVIFRIDENDNKILVSGERRFKAFQALGKETIPAMLIDSEKYDEIALIDNIQRVDLNSVDESEALKNLKTKYDYSEKQIGHLIGKAHNTVSEIIKLNDLSDDIREDARQRKDLSRSALLKIARLKKPKAQRKAYDALILSLSIPKKDIKRPRQTAYKKTIIATEKTLKCLQDIDLEALGDDRESVVSKLQELLVEIQNKLGTTDS
ncbi:MAG: ParB/RepB/Spo0J family partition protein [Desulfuromonadales bacterium]|nr:ParB/RepB/Spo0J family partition protein [Desulfuromonadales bacterium]